MSQMRVLLLNDVLKGGEDCSGDSDAFGGLDEEESAYPKSDSLLALP